MIEAYPYSKSHPDNLAVMATLFGMSPPPADECRVLELGCGAGGNLIPMACALPRSSFRGVDLSKRQIEQGLEVVRALGLTNIELQHRSIADVGPEDGLYDYIICHGVYSWVSTTVKQKILSLCRHNLIPRGVAYVSYNTYPGWHLRGMVREMMRFHAAGFEGVNDRVGQSRALLDFLISAIPADGSAYDMLLRDEMQIVQATDDSYLFHEHLEDVNEAIYFHEFAERAANAGLNFLCEAQLSAMVSTGFSTPVQESLREIASDIIHMEQYLDFLRNRTFRRTLLCHREVRLNREIGSDQVRSLRVSSPLVPSAAEDPSGDEKESTFQHPSGATVSICSPLQKAALLHLGQIWPRSITFDKLLACAQLQLTAGESREQVPADAASLGELVLECFASDLVELHSFDDSFISAVGPRPRAYPLARYQADRGKIVTNLRHETVQLGELDRHTLRLLDGTNDQAALTEELSKLVGAAKLVVQHNEIPLTDPTSIREVLADALEQILPKLATHALLVG